MTQPKPLTPRQLRFVDEYCVDLNATAAYLRVYGGSQRAAEANSARLMRDDRVRAAIEDRRRLLAMRTGITPERVLEELGRIAFSDMRDYARWGPTGVELIDSDDMPPEVSRAVSEVAETVTKEGGSKRFKLHNKVEALVQIGRHFGMFTDKFEEVAKLPPEERKRRLLKLLA